MLTRDLFSLANLLSVFTFIIVIIVVTVISIISRWIIFLANVTNLIAHFLRCNLSTLWDHVISYSYRLGRFVVINKILYL